MQGALRSYFPMSFVRHRPFIHIAHNEEKYNSKLTYPKQETKVVKYEEFECDTIIIIPAPSPLPPLVDECRSVGYVCVCVSCLRLLTTVCPVLVDMVEKEEEEEEAVAVGRPFPPLSPSAPPKTAWPIRNIQEGRGGGGSGYLPPPPPVWNAGSSYAGGGGRAEIKVEAGKFRRGIRSSSRDSWQNLERQSDAVPEKEEGIRRGFQPIKRGNWRKGTLISHYSRIMVVFLQIAGKKRIWFFKTKGVLKESESCRLFSQICAIRACGQNCPYAEIQ